MEVGAHKESDTHNIIDQVDTGCMQRESAVRRHYCVAKSRSKYRGCCEHEPYIYAPQLSMLEP
jgi:hypothetical protein